MNAFTIFKGVAGFAASIGVGTVVGNLVRATTPDTIGRISLVSTKIGTYVIGAAVGSLVATSVEKQLDDLAAVVNEAKKQFADAKVQDS